MNRLGYFITLSILFISIYGLFVIKGKVSYLNKDIRELRRQLEHDQSSIHVLKAEWAYLNQPNRLRELNARYLNLKPINTKQIINKRDQVTAHHNFYYQTADTQKKKVKWRYKSKNLIINYKGSNKPFITISGN